VSSSILPFITPYMENLMVEVDSTASVLASNLVILLRENGWTKTKLGQESGVTTRYIHDIMNKTYRPSVHIVDKLASAFGLSPWQLISPFVGWNSAMNGRLMTLLDRYEESTPEVRKDIDRYANKKSLLSNQKTLRHPTLAVG